MLKLVLNRLLSVIPVMGVVAITVFLMLRVSPGDPAVVMAGDNADEETLARIREGLGLDKPILVQFGIWILRVLEGDLGTSIFLQVPVAELIAQRLGPTMYLALLVILPAILIAVPLGTWAGARAHSWVDRMVMTASVLGFSLPSFVVAYCLIYVFSMQLGWFPVQGYRSPSDGVLEFLRSIALPALTLGLVFIVLIARITRTSVVEAMTEDCVRTARAKGVREELVVVRHALRNSAVPILSAVGIGIGVLIGGVVVTETVFNIPGIGRLVVDAVSKRDYPIIQGVVLVLSAIYVLANLLLDISFAFLDPRIRY